MVHVFYYRISSRLPATNFNAYLQTMPVAIQKRITAYRHWEDAERSLAGYLLLQKSVNLIKGAPADLDELKHGDFSKPYFKNDVYFNISHSGKYTVCAVSEMHEVGIDIELLNDIPVGDFTEFFEANEWSRVLNSPDPVKAFYMLWTKKEAFLKLIGSGLNVPLSQVIILDDNRIDWEGKQYTLQQLHIDPVHLCHLCTSHPPKQVEMVAVTL